MSEPRHFQKDKQMFYAIVFQRSFQPGEHWSDHLPESKPGQKFVHGKHRAPDDDPDRRQTWRAGDLYSTGTVVGALPDHLEAIEFASAPIPGSTWDRETRQFLAP